MIILLTNSVLAGRSGTEIVVAQLADELRRRGHRTILYSPLLGELALRLRRAGHQVFDRIADIRTTPEVIHAHHLGPALTAVTAFPATPAVFLSHSVESEFDAMPRHPSIVRYLAISDHVRPQRARSWLPVEQIEVVGNAVDLASYPSPRPAPPRPQQALAVVKYRPGLETIECFCAKAGISLECVGDGVGNITDDLPARFAAADLVFATGRSALEAMAAGSAVILTDGGRFGGLIRRERVESLLNHNLGVYALPSALTEAGLAAALAGYDAGDAAAVTDHVRERAGLERQADRLLEIYRQAIAQGVGAADPAGLASLIEAYVPNHGELPWRRLVRDFLDTASLARLRAITSPAHHAVSVEFGDREQILARALAAEQALAAQNQSRRTRWMRRLKKQS